VLQKAVREAARSAGIAKPATCHSLRHSSATHYWRTVMILGRFKNYSDTGT
jgi:integrase